jgi:SulP family sulfate permease
VRLLAKAGPFCSHELDDPDYYVAEDNYQTDDKSLGKETFRVRT